MTTGHRIAIPALTVSLTLLAGCTRESPETSTTAAPTPAPPTTSAVTPAAETPVETPPPVKAPPPAAPAPAPVQTPATPSVPEAVDDVTAFVNANNEVLSKHEAKVQGLAMASNMMNDAQLTEIVELMQERVAAARSSLDEIELTDDPDSLMDEVTELLAEIADLDAQAVERLKELR